MNTLHCALENGVDLFKKNFFLIAQVMLITHDRCMIDEIRVFWCYNICRTKKKKKKKYIYIYIQ